MQTPALQVSPRAQTCPQLPQFCGSELVTVPPTHGDQGDQVPSLQLRVATPVQLQVCMVAPTHEQVLHWQVGPHVCDPPAVPQDWVWLGMQAPSFAQADQADQVPLA